MFLGGSASDHVTMQQHRHSSPAPFFSTFPGVLSLFWLRFCFLAIGLKLQSGIRF